MNEFSQYIKAIGKGKRAGRYLTMEEAHRAFQLILSDCTDQTEQVTPEQVGAFLMLLRVREESAEELAGFIKACREFSNPQLAKLDVDIDMGCYAGKRRHLPWFLLAVKCLSSSHQHQPSKRIFLHGTAEPDSNRLYLPQVLNELNIPISSTPEQAQQHMDESGFCYMDLINVNPKLDTLIQMRKLFGLRSPANTLARMLNPSQAEFSYHGVFHRHFDERHIEVAKLLGDNKVSCIRGEGGEVEVNPERPFTQHMILNGKKAFIEFPALLENWQIKPKELTPLELKQVWTGELEFKYATQAVIGTLASYFTLIEQVNLDTALTKAKNLWQNRDKSF